MNLFFFLPILTSWMWSVRFCLYYVFWRFLWKKLLGEENEVGGRARLMNPSGLHDVINRHTYVWLNNSRVVYLTASSGPADRRLSDARRPTNRPAARRKGLSIFHAFSACCFFYSDGCLCKITSACDSSNNNSKSVVVELTLAQSHVGPTMVYIHRSQSSRNG